MSPGSGCSQPDNGGVSLFALNNRDVMLKFIRESLNTVKHHPRLGGLEILKYIGPGLLVTVGFIDPRQLGFQSGSGGGLRVCAVMDGIAFNGDADCFAAQCGAPGIVTGLCLSEAAMLYVKPRYARLWLLTAMGASVSTSLAEILGGAIALEMLFRCRCALGRFW